MEKQVYEVPKDGASRLEKLGTDEGLKKVHQIKGLGAPPESFTLPGVLSPPEESGSSKGWQVSSERFYRIRLTAETIYGDRLTSSPLDAAVQAPDLELTAENADTETVSDAFNGATKALNEQLIQKLDRLADSMKENEATLKVEVHTNDNADEAADQKKSEQVGRAIVTILKDKGIAEDRIQLEAKGAQDLVDPGFSAFGAAKTVVWSWC